MRLLVLLILALPVAAAFAAKPQDPITPWAEAHASTAGASIYDNIQFSARGSFDPDDNPLTYSWDFGDGNGAAGLDTSHNYAVPGFYVVVLTVMDSQGLFDISSVEIRVTDELDNQPPVAEVCCDQLVEVGQWVTLDGTASHDPEGDPLSFSWSFYALPAGPAPTFNDDSLWAPSFQPAVEGHYGVVLQVSDGVHSSSRQVDLVVEAAP